MTTEKAKEIVLEKLASDYYVLFDNIDKSIEPVFGCEFSEKTKFVIRFLAKKGIRTLIYADIESDDSLVTYKFALTDDLLAESAKEFNNALLDEQANRIKDLEAKLEKSDSDYINKVHLAVDRGREISRLNDIIHKKNVMIRNLIAERGKVARELSAEKAVHQVDLQATKSAESALLYHEREYEKSLKEKDEVIDDLSRELARSKEREEELIATIKDYLSEIEELKEGKREARKKSKKKMPQMHVSAPKEGRIIIFSSGNPRGNFFDELRKQFFKD